MKVYARTEKETGLVIHIFSEVFEEPQEDDILIEDGTEEHCVHVGMKYNVIDSLMQYNYKIVNGKLVERTDAEKSNERESIVHPASNEQRIADLEEAIAQLVFGGE